MVRLALRRHLFRWISIVAVRSLSGVDPERWVLWALLASWAFLGAWVGSFLWWVLTGGGPWRTLRLNTVVAVAPRGVPPGRFWLREPLRRDEDRPS